MAAAVGLGEDLAAEWVSKRVEAVRDTRRRPAAVGPERGAFSSLDGAPSDDVRCLPGQAQLRARPLAPLFRSRLPTHPLPVPRQDRQSVGVGAYGDAVENGCSARAASSISSRSGPES